jgi:hydrogenase maturation protein HypF
VELWPPGGSAGETEPRLTPNAVPPTRLSILVRGAVQRIGFRPFVRGLAARLELAGFVKNRRDGVAIEVEGPAVRVATFLDEIRHRPPASAAIEEL